LKGITYYYSKSSRYQDGKTTTKEELELDSPTMKIRAQKPETEDNFKVEVHSKEAGKEGEKKVEDIPAHKFHKKMNRVVNNMEDDIDDLMSDFGLFSLSPFSTRRPWRELEGEFGLLKDLEEEFGLKSGKQIESGKEKEQTKTAESSAPKEEQKSNVDQQAKSEELKEEEKSTRGKARA